MRTRAFHWWDRLTSSYWFLPGLMALAAGLLAALMLTLDRYVLTEDKPTWFYAGGAEGARAVLSTIATSIITVAGVVFSITVATLTQASSQFGPRLLRNFMRDTGNQLVLGTFVATFIFSLLVLRTIHSGESSTQLPHASITTSVVLALASLAVLIYFIHHISVSLQAPNVVAAVAADLGSSLERLFPAHLGTEPPASGPPPELPDGFEEQSATITSKHQGYLQAIESETLMQIVEERDLVIRLDCRPGDFLIRGESLVHVWPPQRCDEALAEEINGTFLTGDERTNEQDVEYAVKQMVEIAVRALSPGINDPFTAITCVDWLGGAIGQITDNDLPGHRRCGAGGKLRIVTTMSTFGGIVDAAFNEIRQYGRGSVPVMIRMLEVLAILGSKVRTPQQAETLLRHAELIHQDAEAHIPNPRDRADLQERYAAAVSALRRKASRQ